jgi:hypothetical protein
MLKRWTDFARFLDDGRICLTNNAAERALRVIALGKRNWTFAGSQCGAERGNRSIQKLDKYATVMPGLYTGVP